MEEVKQYQVVDNVVVGALFAPAAIVLVGEGTTRNVVSIIVCMSYVVAIVSAQERDGEATIVSSRKLELHDITQDGMKAQTQFTVIAR